MWGFVIGGLFAVGAIKAVRRYRRRHHRFGWGPGGYGPRRGPLGWALGGLFERLSATPGQQAAIMAALEQLRGQGKLVREEWREFRGDLERALRGGIIDDGTFEESFARQDRLLAQLRVSVVEAAKQTAEALDEPRRNALADLLARGGACRWGGRWGGDGGRGVWA